MNIVAEMGAYAEGRITKEEATKILRLLGPVLSKVTKKFKIVGSHRRKVNRDYGDLDIVVADTTLDKVYNAILPVVKVISTPRHGEKIITSVIDLGNKHIQLEFTLAESKSFGAALLHSTGSNEFNIALRSRAKKMGLLLNQYGLHNRDTGDYVAGATEEEIFKALGLKFIPSEARDVDMGGAYDLFRSNKLSTSEDKPVDEIVGALAVVAYNHGVHQKAYDKAKSVYDKFKMKKNRDKKPLTAKQKKNPITKYLRNRDAADIRKARELARKEKSSTSKAKSRARDLLNRHRGKSGSSEE